MRKRVKGLRLDAAAGEGESRRHAAGDAAVPEGTMILDHVITAIARRFDTDPDRVWAGMGTWVRVGDTLSRDRTDVLFDFDDGTQSTASDNSHTCAAANGGTVVITPDSNGIGLHAEMVTISVQAFSEDGNGDKDWIEEPDGYVIIAGQDITPYKVPLVDGRLEMEFAQVLAATDVWTVVVPMAENDAEVGVVVQCISEGKLPTHQENLDIATGRAKPEDYQREPLQAVMKRTAPQRRQTGQNLQRLRAAQRAGRVGQVASDAAAFVGDAMPALGTNVFGGRRQRRRRTGGRFIRG